MNKELQKKAEDFIIERYKIAKCYREDNAETREYMRMDVHSQYEEEYQLYLDATKELQKENAELKTDYEVLSCSVGDFDELQNKLEEEQRKNNGLSDNLTKAKEIIKTFLGFAEAFGYSPSMDNFISDTKQFLNSEVKK